MMPYVELLTGLLEEALWPMVTLILVGGSLVYFRKEVRKLFGRRWRGKFGGVEVWIDPEETALRQRTDLENRLQQVEQLLEQLPSAKLPQRRIPAASLVEPDDQQIVAVEVAVQSLCPTKYSKTTVQTVANMLRYGEDEVVGCVDRSNKIQFDNIEALALLGFIHVSPT
ncbi:MAG: hypothetical protein HQ582_21945 [Planctomycetes bacterium]|nr:hypothetical protein [Planctomycetota bacterium]